MTPSWNDHKRGSCAVRTMPIEAARPNWMLWWLPLAMLALLLATAESRAAEPEMRRLDILLDPAALPERDRAASEDRLQAIREARSSGIPLFRSFDARETLQDTLAILSDLGADVGEDAIVNFDSLEVTIPLEAKRELVKLPFIRKIRKPITPVSTGLVDSEGIELTGADIAHAGAFRPPITGTGVSVAVIDRHYRFLDDTIASPDDELKTIPVANQWKQRGTSQANEGIFDNVSIHNRGDREHGTAMAEVIYEMAPDAEIHLYWIDSTGGIETAIQHAVAEGIDIIVIPLTHIETMGDPQNRFTDDINAAVAAGTVVIVAAGNESQRHLNQQYEPCTDCTDDPGTGLCLDANNNTDFHQFTDEFTDPSPLNPLTFDDDHIDAETFDLTCWSAVDPPVGAEYAPEDFEMRLYRYDTGSDHDEPSCPGDSGASSQPGTARNLGEFFTQSISIVDEEIDDIYFYLTVRHKKPGSPPPTFPNFRIACGTGVEEFLVLSTAGSLSDLATVESAITVGEIDGFIEDEPTLTTSHGPALSGPLKPDLSGPGQVFNFTAEEFFFVGDGTFNGSSAAAAHVAGVAALVQSYQLANGLPMLSPDDMKLVLQDNSIDIEFSLDFDEVVEGPDPVTGTGLVQVPAYMISIPLHVESAGICGGTPSCFSAPQFAANVAADQDEIRLAVEDFDQDVVISLPASDSIDLTGGWDTSFTTQGAQVIAISSTPVPGAATMRSLTITGGIVQIP